MTTAALVHLQLPTEQWRLVQKGQAQLIRQLSPADTSYRLFRRKAPDAPPSGGNLAHQVPLSLQHQLLCMQALQPGVEQALDPEFLHQFRINLRRSRAIVESLHEITGADALIKAIKPMKRMARRSSRLRDLDVFVQDLHGWSASDARLRQSLRASGALDFFLEQRAQAHHQLTRHLTRKSWSTKQKTWESFIHGKPLRKILRQARPEAIDDKIGQRLVECRARYRELAPDSPDADFHKVRKSLKRLRYLAELDQNGHRALLAELKEQQTLYGHFQDRHVQLDLLAEFAASRRDGRLPPTLAVLSDQLTSDMQATRRTILATPPAWLQPIPEDRSRHQSHQDQQ